MMERCLQAEWLDELPVEDPGAIGSRRDLERLNAWMGNSKTVARALRRVLPPGKPPRIAELGAGDGQFMCRVAERLGRVSAGTVLLLDRQSSPPAVVARALGDLGWTVEARKVDVFDWLKQPSDGVWDALIANLFLHHFAEPQLVQLLSTAAARARAFLAVEPRRSGCALLFSNLVRLIGCNHVTRHDAPASVRAGFTGRELSNCWPVAGDWILQETPAGLFSHFFVAQRA